MSWHGVVNFLKGRKGGWVEDTGSEVRIRIERNLRGSDDMCIKAATVQAEIV